MRAAVLQGNFKRKIRGLIDGEYGYENDLVAAREFNESLVGKGDQEAIKRKFEGLTSGKYGYKKDPVAAKVFIESLLMSTNPVVRAVGKYIKAFAMKYVVSELGYTRESKKVVEFIKENHVPY